MDAQPDRGKPGRCRRNRPLTSRKEHRHRVVEDGVGTATAPRGAGIQRQGLQPDHVLARASRDDVDVGRRSGRHPGPAALKPVRRSEPPACGKGRSLSAEALRRRCLAVFRPFPGYFGKLPAPGSPLTHDLGFPRAIGEDPLVNHPPIPPYIPFRKAVDPGYG